MSYMKPHEPIKDGANIWFIRASAIKTPEYIVIEKGYVYSRDEFQYWIKVPRKKLISLQPQEMFTSYLDALDYLIIKLKAHLDTYIEERKKITNKENEK